MRLTATLLPCVALFLAGCPDSLSRGNALVGQWQVAVACLQREPGYGTTAPKHLEGTYEIVKSGDHFRLTPQSGDVRDAFSDCELNFNAGKTKTVDGMAFSCESFEPGPDVAHLSGTCELALSGGPRPHSVRIFLIDNSPLYDGQTNPVIQYSDSELTGWLH